MKKADEIRKEKEIKKTKKQAMNGGKGKKRETKFEGRKNKAKGKKKEGGRKKQGKSYVERKRIKEER
jgi:hypothetical protein